MFNLKKCRNSLLIIRFNNNIFKNLKIKKKRVAKINAEIKKNKYLTDCNTYFNVYRNSKFVNRYTERC